jgi:carbonyl reductase 1
MALITILVTFGCLVQFGLAISNNLTMKRILVTGANKGIGKAICKVLLESYPDVHVFLGSRDLARGEKALKEIENSVPSCIGRLELVESVAKAAESIGGELYGIVNNAGIGFGIAAEKNVEVNYFGPRRVNDAFKDILMKPKGRIVNIASASGPNFVSRCKSPELRDKLSFPRKFGTIEKLDAIAKSCDGISDGYGFSKALLNAYTVLHADAEPEFIINSCTPGFIATDMTEGFGATNSPEKGAVTPIKLLMDSCFETLPTGRYYGSDCVRSPLNVYRNPGDPPYEGE